MNRQTDAGRASVVLVCATFGLSRAAYYAEARRVYRSESEPAAGAVIALPRRPRGTSAEVVLRRIREVLARETARAWGVRKVWATLHREGLRVTRRRVHALMRAHGLVLARDHEPGEPARGHVVVPEPNRRFATDLTTVWTRKVGVIALVPTIDCGDRTAVITVTKDQHGPAVSGETTRWRPGHATVWPVPGHKPAEARTPHLKFYALPAGIAVALRGPMSIFITLELPDEATWRAFQATTCFHFSRRLVIALRAQRPSIRPEQLEWILTALADPAVSRSPAVALEEPQAVRGLDGAVVDRRSPCLVEVGY